MCHIIFVKAYIFLTTQPITVGKLAWVVHKNTENIFKMVTAGTVHVDRGTKLPEQLFFYNLSTRCFQRYPGQSKSVQPSRHCAILEKRSRFERNNIHSINGIDFYLTKKWLPTHSRLKQFNFKMKNRTQHQVIVDFRQTWMNTSDLIEYSENHLLKCIIGHNISIKEYRIPNSIWKLLTNNCSIGNSISIKFQLCQMITDLKKKCIVIKCDPLLLLCVQYSNGFSYWWTFLIHLLYVACV